VLAATSLCFDRAQCSEVFVPLSSGGTVIMDGERVGAGGTMAARDRVTLNTTRVPSAMAS
jgi:hypothetical protein